MLAVFSRLQYRLRTPSDVPEPYGYRQRSPNFPERLKTSIMRHFWETLGKYQKSREPNSDLQNTPLSKNTTELIHCGFFKCAR